MSMPLINCYSALSVPAWWADMNILAGNLASFPRSVWLNGMRPKDPHQLDKLLQRRPNSTQNAFKFWESVFFHYSHCGNGYAWISRDVNLQPLSLRMMLPEDVTPYVIIPSDGSDPVQVYVYRPTKTVLLGDDVIHFQGLSYDGIAGLDPVQVHEQTLSKALLIDRYQARYLRRGTVISGTIETQKKLDTDQRAQIHSEVQQNFAGPDGVQDVMILSDGATLKNSTVAPQASQLMEQAAHVTKQISQITGVPPEMKFEKAEAKNNNNNAEQAGENVVRYTFRPRIEMIEAELTRKLLSEADQDAGYGVHLDTDALTRGDAAAMIANATGVVSAGIITRNEGRSMIGFPPDASPDSNTLKALGDTSPAPRPGMPKPAAAQGQT
jgi:HK97 family phage portal protein